MPCIHFPGVEVAEMLPDIGLPLRAVRGGVDGEKREPAAPVGSGQFGHLAGPLVAGGALRIVEVKQFVMPAVLPERNAFSREVLHHQLRRITANQRSAVELGQGIEQRKGFRIAPGKLLVEEVVVRHIDGYGFLPHDRGVAVIVECQSGQLGLLLGVVPRGDQPVNLRADFGDCQF